ncbi:putative Flavin-containing monooxygenase [Sulfitobacter noctilucae]|uniref:FAD-dependent monooxygenase n=1 Tax=Sulfitobacter noctilucae TaxID=1342302 RepID=UPI00046938C6|nr:FAD-dependent monooxygenase [Sulfitobacter noctilucae]KIN61578.1 putative Flavin-containing monooxygenase [Sulfitobacter noctilucae]
MQYHLDGFRPGDPAVQPAQEARDDVDVLIVGCGPAGLTLAAQLSAFPDITTRIMERKAGPLEMGQADGIACRSIEMFEAFGFAEKVLKESYWVNEVAFWRPEADGVGLHRADRIQDVEDDLSEMPHVILSQARIHDFYLDLMRHSSHRMEPAYNRALTTLTPASAPDEPVTATFECLDATGRTETIRARFVVGCDGARSAVRGALGHSLQGEAARQLWGVMDVLAVTDFPDIRLKCAIQSAEHGSMLIIPREGGYLVRMYIELDALTGDERAADRNVSAEKLTEKARDILAPYALEVKEVAWWSAYEIGQRVCDQFDDVPETERATRTPRIFIAGDACHTHSPKAGQGMNVSMADTFNLGWKLAAVLRGQAVPALLHSYSGERQAKAKELIDFDRDMARLFSAKPKDAAEAAQFQRYFKKHGRYTAGVETRYDPSMITGDAAYQDLANGLTVGKRFHSAPVIRLGDGKPMQLGHTLRADGRWRLMAFAGANDEGQAGGEISALCEWLSSAPASPIRRYTPQEADIDSVIDLRAVFQQPHREMQFDRLSPLLRPTKGRYGLTDYEKAFCPDLKSGADVFDLRSVDRRQGALVVVRPDQFVTQVLPLTATGALASFFETFMLAPDRQA